MPPPNYGFLSLSPELLKTAPSPISTPVTPNFPFPIASVDHDHDHDHNHDNFPLRASSPANLPTTRDHSPKEKLRKPSFFSNSRASRSNSKLPKSKSSSPSRNPTSSSQLSQTSKVSHQEPSSMNQVFSQSHGMGSLPDLQTRGSDSASVNQEEPIPSSNTLDVSPNFAAQPKKKSSKHKFNILGGKQLFKDKDPTPQQDPKSKPKTAKSNSSNATANNPSIRARSLERSKNQAALEQTTDGIGVNAKANYPAHNALHAHRVHHAPTPHPSQSSRSVQSNLSRAAKGLLEKFSSRAGLGDSSSSHERSAKHQQAQFEADAQNAALNKSYRVVNQPLEEQTRKTRICKKLEDCKDKTEFWLPAVAYRCIDYLNDKGMTHEGLYRVPGSEREIKNWIWRFDNEHDIDLLAEDQLYDVNAISSMFKGWLRDLPDEIFPKELQLEIIASAGDIEQDTPVPSLLKERLSNLPPFNYYLLFAVTAHLTMLLSASSENRMNFHNLCICFMPALKMEMALFRWLLHDWKNCWQGCSSERQYMEHEYAISQGLDTDYSAGCRPLQHYDRYDQPEQQSAQDSYSYDQARPKTNRSNNSNHSQGNSQVSHARLSNPPRPNLYFQEPSPERPSHFPENDSSFRRRANHVPTALEGNDKLTPGLVANNTSSNMNMYSQFKSYGEFEHPAMDSLVPPTPNVLSKSPADSAFDFGTPRGDKDGAVRLGDIPELSPVKPLSPFGSLG